MSEPIGRWGWPMPQLDTWTTLYAVSMKRNLTVQLDEDVIGRAKVVAARRGMSVSGLVARCLDVLVDEDDRYESARRRAIAAMADADGHGGVISWRREDLYDRSIDAGGRDRS